MKVPIYPFPSELVRHIEIAIEQRMWAVPESAGPVWSGRKTKAEKMRVGSIGVFYCSEGQFLSVPFVIMSEADITSVVEDVWPGTWQFPFRIHPIGNLGRRMHKDRAYQILSELRQWGRDANISQHLNVAPNIIFVPKLIQAEDFRILIDELAS
jgi:hypothetical protein